MPNTIRNLVLVGVGALLLVVWWTWRDLPPSTDSSVPEDSVAETPSPSSPAAPPAPPRESGPVSKPGDEAEFHADIDGRVRLDDSGRLVPDIGLRHLFDYFIGTADDPPEPEAVRHALAGHLADKGHTTEIIAEVMALFDRYLEYQQAAADVSVPSQDAETLESVLEELFRLRRSILGPTLAEAFFADEEAYDRYAIERRRILEAEHYDEDERRQMLDMLDQQLPENLAGTRDRSLRLRELTETEKRLREQGASHEEIDQSRRELLGDEAAERLSQLDAQRAEWDRRVREFRQQRDALLRQPGLSDNDRQQAIEKLIEDNFSEHEARRLNTLDRLQESQQ